MADFVKSSFPSAVGMVNYMEWASPRLSTNFKFTENNEPATYSLFTFN